MVEEERGQMPFSRMSCLSVSPPAILLSAGEQRCSVVDNTHFLRSKKMWVWDQLYTYLKI